MRFLWCSEVHLTAKSMVVCSIPCQENDYIFKLLIFFRFFQPCFIRLSAEYHYSMDTVSKFKGKLEKSVLTIGNLRLPTYIGICMWKKYYSG